MQTQAIILRTLLSLLLVDKAVANISCLLTSIAIEGESGTPVPFDTFGFLMNGDLANVVTTLCGDSPDNCDLDGTATSTDAIALCNSVNGTKIFYDNLEVCGNAIAEADGLDPGSVSDVNFKNIPICLSDTCPDGSKVFEMIDPFLGKGLLTGLDSFEKLLSDDSCNAGTADSGDTTASGGGTSSASTLGAHVTVLASALVMALFVL